MEQAAGQDTSAEADQLREDLTSPTSARITGVPHAKDPHAGEHRIAATLDKINLLAARERKHASTWTGSYPSGRYSVRTTGSC
ncbi:hypothetical protein [Corynebacterium belfantii]|uniref:hypothetical protein n=1 Tax=Corynebacterium belfantii TaxID=2014537 RepID=UPI001E4833CF|nr:hypothetical protein [Corynebacterium belfantii]